MTDTKPWRSKGAERTDWRDHAACRRMDPDLFFPVSASGASLPEIETARRVCQRCPVLAPCLRWALDLGQVSGIWGGTTEEERRANRAFLQKTLEQHPSALEHVVDAYARNIDKMRPVHPESVPPHRP
jgi:WhiB family redox-sensing transcriptional regulator